MNYLQKRKTNQFQNQPQRLVLQAEVHTYKPTRFKCDIIAKSKIAENIIESTSLLN